MPKATDTHTTPTPTPEPDVARPSPRTTTGHRGLLGGAVALPAGAAAVTLPRSALATEGDPVLTLWGRYDELLRQHEPVSDS